MQTAPCNQPGIVEVAPGRYAEALAGPEEGPAILDRWRPWLVLTAVLLLLAYGHPLVHLASNTPLNVPGMRVW
jgi:cytochrome c oxidase subunit 1